MSKNRKEESRPEIKKLQHELPEELQEIENDLISHNPEIFKGLPPKKIMEILHSLSVVSVQH